MDINYSISKSAQDSPEQGAEEYLVGISRAGDDHETFTINYLEAGNSASYWEGSRRTTHDHDSRYCDLFTTQPDTLE